MGFKRVFPPPCPTDYIAASSPKEGEAMRECRCVKFCRDFSPEAWDRDDRWGETACFQYVP